MSMRETTPRPISALGATRPDWCPPERVPRDVCEIKYPMDLPIIGVTEVGLPVYRVTYDMMEAATQRLPEFLPQIYQDLQPYIADLTDDVVRTVEYEADFLADKMMREQVEPVIEEFTDELEVRANKLVNELLVTTAALSGAVIIAVGVAAWWVRSKG
jgi:hypothetical protein